MKKNYIIAIILLLTFCKVKMYSQNLLPAKWKFKTGDSLEWVKLSYNDKNWKEISAHDYWENQGYPGYDGFAWYRATVVIPSKFKSDATKYGGFALNLGKIDDADNTYFNGEFLSRTGDVPPNYIGKYNEPRNYVIPVEKIKWDQPNLIAVRVYDAGGNGGIYSDPIELVVKGISDLFVINVEFKESDRILKGITDAVIPLSIKNGLDKKFEGKLTMNLYSDFKKEISVQTLDVKIGKNSLKTISFTVKNIESGFYKCDIKMNGDIVSKSYSFKFGVEPEKIKSPTDRQPDFQNYWDRAKKELAAVDPQYKLIKVDTLCTQTKDFYLVEMRSLGNVLIRGWYSVPKKAGKYPAILQVQGYATVMVPSNINYGDDFVSFGLNIRGHGNSKDNVNPGFPGYLQYFVTDKEQYIYRGAYMDCVRAVDFLYSRPEVDTSRVAVEGASQGGALTYATAALDNQRIKLCAPQVPFLSDFRDYFVVAVWPGNEFFDYFNKHPKTEETVYKTLSYIDIKNLAPWIKAPVIMGVGLIDDVCPPHINFAAYNNVSSPKQYIVYPLSGHGLPPDFWVTKMKWIREKFGMK